jgi:hypothetical protein
MKKSGEIIYRLDNNWHLVYSPVRQTIPILCPVRKQHKPENFIPKGISNHFIFSGSSISSDSRLEHIKLPDVCNLNILNVLPEHLESIMSEMTKDGMYRPTMNDIIEAHEHLKQMTEQTSLFTSLIMWTVFGILFVIIIAFLLYIFHYFYQILATFTTILKINTRKTLRTFNTTFLPRPSSPA